MKVKNSEVIFSGLILGAAMHIYCVAKTFYNGKKPYQETDLLYQNSC